MSQMEGAERTSRSAYPAEPIPINQRSLSPLSSLNRAPSGRRPSVTRNSRSRSSFSSAGRVTSSSMPAMDGLVLLSQSGSALEDEDDEDFDFEDEEGALKPRRGSTSRKFIKGEQQFQCEKCGKFYRHPACLTKHRWQHTRYWQEASKLMLSKHQSVQMLEAAAILINGHAMPDEKSLWPAAVSPPSSGLLGSEQLNSEVLSRVKTGSSPLSGPALVLPAVDDKVRGGDNDDTSSEASSGMDLDSRMDEADMFDFEMGEMDLEGGSAGTSGPEDGSFSSSKMPNLPSARMSPFHAAYAARKAGRPSEYGISAPSLGFFEVRH